MISRLGIIVILGVTRSLGAQAGTANPPALSQASMDVANIISIVIPEGPDETINVQRLTDEFRQRLERIKKQSRGPAMSPMMRIPAEVTREERRKALQLSRRVLYGRRGSSPAGSRNWTREARRLEQAREGGQFTVRARSPADPDQVEIVRRDYEENGSLRDAGSLSAEEYRRIGENRAFLDRREESSRRADTVRQQGSLRRGDAGRRDDGVFFVEEETGKVSRPIRDGGDENWEGRDREEGRIYPGASDQRRGKLERLVLQRDRSNEIRGSVNYEKPARRGRDSLGLEPSAFVNYPREFEIDASADPSCDRSKRNRTVQAPKDVRSMSGSPKILGGVGQDSEPANVSARENIPGGDQYVTAKNKKKRKKVKKKRGHVYFQDGQGPVPMRDQDLDGVRTYDDHLPVHFPENPPDLYVPFGEGFPGPEVPDDQMVPVVFQPTADNDRPRSDSRATFDYGGAGLPMRIQRAINASATQVPRLHLDKNILERLERLLKIGPRSPVLSYKRVVLVYGNVNGSRLEGDDGRINQEEKSTEFTSAPSMAESMSWTNLDLAHSDRPMVDSPTIPPSKFAIRTL